MKLKLIILFFSLAFSVLAQRAADGENYFNNKQYAKAKVVYEALLKQRPNDALYNYRYARCCYELKEMELAIRHFEMAGTRYPLRDMYLGELYYNTYRFDESVMAYQTFVSTLKPDDIKRKEFEPKIKQAEFAARLLSRVEDIAIVDSVSVNKADFLRFYKFSSDLGSLDIESIKMPNKSVKDKVKYTTQRQDRVYFSDSIRGRMDIFTSYKLLDEWSAAVSISDNINTRANENYPFLLLDGLTLYFASDGENSIGGYDLFITRYTPSSDSFLTPENIGMPFNSPYNDYMMVIDEQHQIGWFASDRFQPQGKVMIYTFVPNAVKTIIRSEDKEYIRRAAQLKTFRKVKKVKVDAAVTPDAHWEETGEQINFVVNDTIVYTHIDQFKSEEALSLWNDAHKLSLEIKNKESELESLRIQYSQTESAEEKSQLAVRIIDMEKKLPEKEKQLLMLKIQVRNTEIKFLENLLLQSK